MTKRDRREYMKRYGKVHYQKPEVKEMRRIYSLKYSKQPHIRARRSVLREQRRDFIFKTLGQECAHCGFKDRRALQMDHIHGRKGEKRLGNIDNRWRFVRDFPDKAKAKYQILCANCNFIKREENKEHFYHSLGPL